MYEQQYNRQDSKQFPYVLFRVSGGSSKTECSDLSAIYKGKGIYLEIFRNTETNLKNMICEKRLKRLGLFNQKKEKKEKREREGLKKGFINKRSCWKQEKRNRSSVNVVSTSRDNSVKL